MDELLIEPEPTERELRTAPIKPLFARYAAITFAGMLAQMVMVVLEGLIIGNGLGPLGLAAVTVILPLELLNLALGGALGMGTAAAAGQRLGSGDTAGAQKVFNQGFWLAAYLLVALSAAIALFAPQIATMLGATPDIHDDVTAFIRLLMCFYPFCILGQMMSSVLRVDEKPGLATAAMFGSAVLAIVWLYCSIFLANMGVAGAAVYYGLSIGLWFVAVFYFVFSKHTKFKIAFSDMKLEGKLCKEILTIGLPTFLVQAASLLYTIVINNYLGVLGGDLEIGAFAILNGYLVYILNMMWLCSTYGVQPLASVNNGAKRPDRLKTLIRASLVDTAAAIAVVSALFILCAVPICTIFCGDEPDLIALAAAMVAIIVWGVAAWYFGIPTSQSHSLIAGITGAAIALQGGLAGVNGDEWMKVIYGLVISTFLGFGTGWLFTRLIKKLCWHLSRAKANSFFKWAQIISGAGVAVLHGAQDGQKFLSLCMLGIMIGMSGAVDSNVEFPFWLIILVSATMALGTAVGGKKIIKSVGMNMVKMEQYQGFAACLSACFCIGLATFTGMPVSTTHTKTTAIMGVGAEKSIRTVKWGLAGRMVLTWILTFPGCGLLAFAFTHLFLMLF